MPTGLELGPSLRRSYSEDQQVHRFPAQPEYNGYVFGGSVHVPHYSPNLQATIVLRAYNGSSWESSMLRGESQPIIVQFSNPSGPTAELLGLQGFSVQLVPEPSTLAMVVMGGALLLLKARDGKIRTTEKRNRSVNACRILS